MVAVVAASYIIVGVMMTRKGEVTSTKQTAMTGSEGATSIIRNFQHIESYLDKIGWELSAKQAELLENKANLQGIMMRFYTPERDVIFVTGDKGSIDLKNSDVNLKGNVQAAYNETYYFYSEEVSWNDSRKLLTSPGPVRIVGPQGEITGHNLFARPLRKRFILRGGVTALFKGGLKSNLRNPTGEPS